MKILLVLLVWTGITVNAAVCLTFNFTSFSNEGELTLSNSAIAKGALQVTLDNRGNISNQSGRVVFKKPFKLFKKQKLASFNSIFVLNILNQTDVSGEGLAFILTKDSNLPTNSDGQWLGLVNPSSNGSSESGIVAVEFDTKKSFPEDLDDNHVGLDVNSVYSDQQVSLNNYGIRIANGTDITVMIGYDGAKKVLNVSVSKGTQNSMITSWKIDLSQHLSSEVYVGFSASTGKDTELNCVKSWYFSGENLDEKLALWIWIVISASSLVVLVCAVGGWLYWRFKLKQKQAKNDEGISMKDMETGLGPKKFKLKDLKAATGNFNAKNELGRGGFGVVYKGIWNDRLVAVKRIVNTPQGKQNLVAEVTTIGGVHHKNLVELLGWCYESNELLLVYEYMPNGSLDTLIDIESSKATNLSWETRHGIICGVAQALDYLHHECSKRVLHRDIKPSNIMLDSNFNARLGDFGLARMFNIDEKTHHTTKDLMGTPGYMAPEVFHMGRTTAETDVFAFGILVLVVASGRSPGNVDKQDKKYGTNVVDWVWGLNKSGMIVNAIDPKLGGEFDKGQAECMLVLGLACCHPNPYMRPSMRNALQVLMGEVSPPFVPSKKPVFMWPVSLPSFIQLDYSLSLDGEGDDID